MLGGTERDYQRSLLCLSTVSLQSLALLQQKPPGLLQSVTSWTMDFHVVSRDSTDHGHPHGLRQQHRPQTLRFVLYVYVHIYAQECSAYRVQKRELYSMLVDSGKSNWHRLESPRKRQPQLKIYLHHIDPIGPWKCLFHRSHLISQRALKCAD